MMVKLARDGLIAQPMWARRLFSQTSTLVFLILAVVAGEEFDVGIPFESNDMGGDAVEEPAVMGNDHHRTGEFQQGIFQGAQGFYIEVIGRLVEQQDVATTEQGCRQMQVPRSPPES